jgi:hypothetical protein
MKHEEHAIQVAIADFLRVALPETAIFFAVPNGAELKGKSYDKGGGKTGRYSPAAERLKREGLTPGVADLIVIDADPFPGGGSRVIGLEVKSAKGRPSEDQKEWAQKAQKAGVRYYVVRSIEDAARALASEGVRLRAIPSTVPGRLYQSV